MAVGSILIVDDEESIRFTLSNFLDEEGYQTATAVGYDDSLHAIADSEFDLIYVDIILDGRSGIDLLEEIKRRAPASDVIIITGAPTIESAARALRLGALDYIVKPVRQDTLLRSADMAFKHRALREAKESCRLNMEAIFRSVRDAIITVDGDLHVVEVNHAAEGLCGVRRDRAVGKSLEDLDLGCAGTCLEALRHTVSSGGPVEIRNLECRAGGRTRVLSVTATPLVSDDDSPSGGVLVIRDETRLFELEQTLREQREIGQIVGTSESIRGVLSTVRALADVQTSVLITGESGTGKELVADALHAIGPRSDRPLVKVNCSALSESLLESELFGHVRGAFTGADRDKVGRFERADGGTIFLDEIGEITPRMQLRFLRVLESMEFERVGDSTPLRVDLRVIAATNRDLKARVSSGEFREDLYFRLKVFEIAMPPLRARRDDIPLLVHHFIDRFNVTFTRQVHCVSDAVMELFMRYDWPGNVRELENTLEHAFVLCHSPTIRRRDLPADLLATAGEVGPREGAGEPPLPVLSPGEVLPLDEMEHRYLEWVTATHGGDRSELASKLGLSERTFYRKLRRMREGNDGGTDPDHHA